MHLRTHRLFCCAGAVDLKIGRFFPALIRFFLACALVLIVHAMLAVHANATSTYIYIYFMYMLYAYAQGQLVVFAVLVAAVGSRESTIYFCSCQVGLACTLVLIVHDMLAVHAHATSTYKYNYFL